MNGKEAEDYIIRTEEPFRMELLDLVGGAVFDLDGTLVDSMPFHIAAWQETLREYDLAVSPEWLMNHGGIPSYVIAEMLTAERSSPAGETVFPNPRELARIKTANYRRRIHEIRVFPEMLAVLGYLKDRGVPIAVGTGTQRENAETIISETVLCDYICTVVSEADIRKPKPDPETFLMAAERIGVPPESCAVFEDSPTGIAAALKGNFRTVQVVAGLPRAVINFRQPGNPGGISQSVGVL
ncbi:HAD family hydrolase [Succinimonas amylolytica]|uniref:HAD family hydrolase n=1 Tax=Succinimonas amylolytica TaxID=83769 RepID=UPI0023A85DC5